MRYIALTSLLVLITVGAYVLLVRLEPVDDPLEPAVLAVEELDKSPKPIEKVEWSGFDFYDLSIPYLASWSLNSVSKDAPSHWGMMVIPPDAISEIVSLQATYHDRDQYTPDHSYLLKKSSAHTFVGTRYAPNIDNDVYVYATDSITAHRQYTRRYIIQYPDHMIEYSLVFYGVTQETLDSHIETALGMSLELFESELAARITHLTK